MKLSEIRSQSIEKLTKAETERPAYVTDLLLSRHLNMARYHFIANSTLEIDDKVAKEFFDDVEKRVQKVPLSYILSESEFYGLNFKVGPGCLIPRPETELLVEEMLSLVKGKQKLKFADWCTGSGCIGITIAVMRQDFSGFCVDASNEALMWAKQNIKLHGVSDRLSTLLNSDPSKADVAPESLDFVTANPPYIPSADIPCLMRDVRDYEPKIALDGGDDGLGICKMLFESVSAMLKQGGYYGFEHGGDAQAEQLKKIAPDSLALVAEIKDYSGISRHLIYQKK